LTSPLARPRRVARKAPFAGQSLPAYQRRTKAADALIASAYLAHAPERLHEQISNDYKDMICAATKQEVEAKRKAFIRKWRLKCRAVADSLEEVRDKLFTFPRFPQSQWKSIRTSNAIERLHEEFKRRIKTQTVLYALQKGWMKLHGSDSAWSRLSAYDQEEICLTTGDGAISALKD
jgi:transposase-like protein